MVHMAPAYLTKKQIPCSFWFYAVMHTAWMMNAIPGKHSGCLALLFLLVHSVGHNEHTWVPLFSLCFFQHKQDGNVQGSHHQAHAMDGIVIGCLPTSNALLVYNPCNKQYYEPNSYRIDPYHHPGSAYPSIKYDDGLFVNLLRDNNPQFKEKYPPGTHVKSVDPVSNMLLSGTVMDICFPAEVSVSSNNATNLPYMILFNDGTTASIPLSQMASLIPPPPVTPIAADSDDLLLPPFLCLNSRITFGHKGISWPAGRHLLFLIQVSCQQTQERLGRSLAESSINLG
jgi:hypothetical protein